MKRGTVRYRLLDVVKSEALTKEEVLARAKTRDFNELRHLCDADLIEQEANRFRITERGLERLGL